MKIEVQSGAAKATIDPQGAYLTNLSDGSDDIIFPKDTLVASDGTEKVRGGIHVCLPNFGPGGGSGQPQHGYGRESLWEVSDSTSSSVLLTLQRGRGDYVGLEAVLTYQLSDHLLIMTLELINNGTHTLRVAPAFHPYFSLPNDDLIINDKKQGKNAFKDTVFEKSSRYTLKQGVRTISISSKELPMWALWTDELGNYFCIEPTTDGYSFLESKPKTEELLAAGSSKTYQATITW